MSHLSRNLTLLAAFAGAATLGACAAQWTPEQQEAFARGDCFFVETVSGFAPGPNDQTVYLRAGVNDVYELRTTGVCRDVNWTNQIGIRTRTGASSICTGFDAELLIPSFGGQPDRCPVIAQRRLSAEEVAALPARSRP
jgi:hypothetical protein